MITVDPYSLTAFFSFSFRVNTGACRSLVSSDFAINLLCDCWSSFGRAVVEYGLAFFKKHSQHACVIVTDDRIAYIDVRKLVFLFSMAGDIPASMDGDV